MRLLIFPLILVAGLVCRQGELFAAAGPEPATGQIKDSEAQPLVIFEALCNALRDNYPMLELAGWRDPEWPREFQSRIEAAPTREAALELMDELVCRLNDYHTRLTWTNQPRMVSAPFRVEPVVARGDARADHGIWGQLRPPLKMPALEGVAIVVTLAADNSGLAPGDQILSVGDVPVSAALAQAWPHSVCSSVAGKLRASAGLMLRGPPGSELKVTVRRRAPQGGEVTLTVLVNRSIGPAENTISSREVNGIPVIRITRWGNDGATKLETRFDELLAPFRDRPALVIDVRGNGGGQDELASRVAARFLAAPVIASISFHRQAPGLTFERTVDRMVPRGPWRYEGRVAVLIDEGCMSACEHFVSGMSEAGALLCGTPTSGACGWIRPVDLPGGVRLNVSQTFPLHSGGMPSPQAGIAPHLWAPRTMADLRAGDETALRAAIVWLESKDPLPTRFQPLTAFSR